MQLGQRPELFGDHGSGSRDGQPRRSWRSWRGLLQGLLGFVFGMLLVFGLEHVPRHTLLAPTEIGFSRGYASIILVMALVFATGVGLGARSLMKHFAASGLSPLARVSLSLALLLCLGTLVFGITLPWDANLTRAVFPLLTAVITIMAIRSAKEIREGVMRRPPEVRALWVGFVGLFLAMLLAYTVLPAQRTSDVVQLYVPLLESLGNSQFSPADPNSSNLWWYFLSRGRGIDSFLARDFGADLHPLVSTLFLASAALSAASLTQFLLPRPAPRHVWVRLLPPLLGLAVLLTPTFPVVIGRFHAETFFLILSLILGVAVLIQRRSKMAAALSLLSGSLLSLQIPLASVFCCFVFLVWAILVSRARKQFLLALGFSLSALAWGAVVVLWNIQTVGIGEVSPYSIFKLTQASGLQDWTSVDYLEYLNASQGLSELGSQDSLTVDRLLANASTLLPLAPSDALPVEAIQVSFLLILVVLTLMGARTFATVGVRPDQYRVSCLLLAVGFSWFTVQVTFGPGSVSRILFAQSSLAGIWVLSAAIQLSRLARRRSRGESFSNFLVVALLFMVIMSVLNWTKSSTYFLPRQHSIIERAKTSVAALAGMTAPARDFFFEPAFDLEICGEIATAVRGLSGILPLNSATLDAPMCFAQYYASKDVYFIDSLNRRLSREFPNFMMHDPRTIRAAFDRAGASSFVIFRGDVSFFGAGFSPVFDSASLQNAVFVQAKTRDFYLLSLDPAKGRRFEPHEILEISKMRQRALRETPYADGLSERLPKDRH